MLIPEAVLGTKEPSEKSRNAAFDLVVSMGKKMNDGGVVKRSMMDGMDEEEEAAPDGQFAQFQISSAYSQKPSSVAVANIDEFITMMAGGLAGASPHMISATITALSRLVFEFKGLSYPSLPTSPHPTPKLKPKPQMASPRKCTTSSS